MRENMDTVVSIVVLILLLAFVVGISQLVIAEPWVHSSRYRSYADVDRREAGERFLHWKEVAGDESR